MTDHEINRLLAEIAGHPLDDSGRYAAYDGQWREWSPLTNPEQTWPLIVQEEIALEPGYLKGAWGAQQDSVGLSACIDPDPLRAVAMAILAKHGRLPTSGES